MPDGRCGAPEGTPLDRSVARSRFQRRQGIIHVELGGLLPGRELLEGVDVLADERLRGHQGEGAPPVGTPVDEPVEVLVEAFEGAGIRAWSMATEGTIIREKDFMCDRSHWDAKGHRVMAGGIMMRLQMDGLLDELRARRAANPR